MRMSRRDDDDDLEEGEDEVIGGAHRRPMRREEFPDDEDFQASIDDTDPCPHCGAAIYVDGEWCPKCGKFLSKEEGAATIPTWAVAVGVVLLVAMVLAVVLGS